MNLPLKKTVVGISMMFTAGFSVAAGCPAVVDSIWQSSISAAEETVSAAIEGMVQTVSTQRMVNLGRIQSAIKVLTKQVELTNEKISVTDTTAKQAAANFAGEVQTRKNVFLTMMEYNPATGQGYDPCGELKKTQEIAIALGEANSNMQGKVLAEIDTAPGKISRDPGATVLRRITDAKGKYCTPDEVKSGFCATAGTLAGKDVDAAHFFTTAATGSDAIKAKNDMLNHMYGVPYKAPAANMAKSQGAASFWEAKRNEDAYRSISQASMKAIQSWTEINDGTGDSVLGAIAKKVATYAGGENYQAWEVSKTSQSEHGLLVDYAKMNALDLWMMNLEYQQAERMEANLAAMLAIRARGMGGSDQAAAAAGVRSKVTP